MGWIAELQSLEDKLEQMLAHCHPEANRITSYNVCYTKLLRDLRPESDVLSIGRSSACGIALSAKISRVGFRVSSLDLGGNRVFW